MSKEADFTCEVTLGVALEESLGILDTQVAMLGQEQCPKCSDWWFQRGGREAFRELACGFEISQRHAEYILRLIKTTRAFVHLISPLQQALTSYYRRKKEVRMIQARTTVFQWPGVIYW